MAAMWIRISSLPAASASNGVSARGCDIDWAPRARAGPHPSRSAASFSCPQLPEIGNVQRAADRELSAGAGAFELAIGVSHAYAYGAGVSAGVRGRAAPASYIYRTLGIRRPAATLRARSFAGRTFTRPRAPAVSRSPCEFASRPISCAAAGRGLNGDSSGGDLEEAPEQPASESDRDWSISGAWERIRAANVERRGGWDVPWDARKVAVVMLQCYIGGHVCATLSSIAAEKPLELLLRWVCKLTPPLSPGFAYYMRGAVLMNLYKLVEAGIGLLVLHRHLEPWNPSLSARGLFNYTPSRKAVGAGIAGFLLEKPIELLLALAAAALWHMCGPWEGLLGVLWDIRYALELPDGFNVPSLGTLGLFAARFVQFSRDWGFQHFELVGNVIYLGFLAPIWEETLFRGFLLPSMSKYLPIWAAIGLSSLLFAALHQSPLRLFQRLSFRMWAFSSLAAEHLTSWPAWAKACLSTLLNVPVHRSPSSPAQMVVSGCLYGLLYARTRSLASPIVTHGLVNVAAFFARSFNFWLFWAKGKA